MFINVILHKILEKITKIYVFVFFNAGVGHGRLSTPVRF